MNRPLYRLRQFFQAARANQLSKSELQFVAQYLPNAGLELFTNMPPGDQRHSLAVARTLIAHAHREKPLLQAALLHDVAKARIGLLYRVLAVLLNAFSQDALARLASADPRSWRHPFYLSLHHPELGARLAARAGLDPRAVALIREHQSPMGLDRKELAQWQHLLKSVDNQN